MNNIESEVKLLHQQLDESPEAVSNPALIVISGLPGTGKSYFSRKLADRMPCIIVESDEIRKRIFKYPAYDDKESRQLFSICHKFIEELLQKGCNVVLDATNLVEQHRERLYMISRRQSARLILVRTTAPEEVVRQRLSNRKINRDSRDNSDADWSVYHRMQPTEEKIGRNYFCADTSGDIRPVIDKIIREVKR